ncbi:ShlB/FhaC/HecB family hemolysin secretion/activation protein [Roseobacter sp. EG26]|uniref:ShlB/FhaC/HecB family hemolysin secretion/activation protein n=1 Tax=Roseobacter sp. EG26 TaxID=3412477 RepID=UPI003CE506C0
MAILAAVQLTVSAQLAVAQENDPGERLLEEERRRAQQENLARNGAGQSISIDAAKGPVEEAVCFPIKQIVIKGSTVLPASSFAEVLAEFEEKCLGQVSIGHLLERLSGLYANKGYITSRAYVPGQDVSSGQLVIEILEGRIEAIAYQQTQGTKPSKPGKPRKIKSAFPQRSGDVFQLRDLEHGLEQMNRLRSSQANANLIAGAAPGTSQIVVTERKNDLVRGTVGFDNRGDEVTGRTQIRLNLEADDVLGINDTYSLSYSGSENSNAVAFGLSAPYRRWLFSASGSYSESLSPVTPTSDLFTQTANLNLRAERLLSRDDRTKSFGYISVSSYWNERFVNIAALTPQHRSSFRVGHRFEYRGLKSVIATNTSISFGSGLFGADRDPVERLPGVPRTDFRKIESNVTYIRPFDSGRQLSVVVVGQLANGALFSNEQLSIGGWESVRGYSGFSSSGDSGAFVRSELSFRTISLDFSRFGKPLENTNLWNPLQNAKGGFRPFLFADAGYVTSRATRSSASFFSAGVGFSTQVGATSLNGTLAFPLRDDARREVDDFQAFVGLTIKIF